MHEMSLAESMVGIVTDAAARERVQHVKSVLVEVGELSCVAPDALRFCFDAVARGTPVEGAQLEIARIAGEGACRACGGIAPMAEPYALCPACGSADMELRRGMELRVIQIEAA